LYFVEFLEAFAYLAEKASLPKFDPTEETLHVPNMTKE